MRSLKVIAMIFASILLFGCQSLRAYHGKQSVIFHDRTSDRHVAGGLLKVAYDGVPQNTSDEVKDYLMFRIAEIGKEKNKKYFAIYTTLSNAADGVMSLDPEVIDYSDEFKAYAYVQYHDEWEPGDKTVSDVYERIGKKIGVVKEG